MTDGRRWGSARYAGPPLTVATWGTWVITYTVGGDGLDTGSTVRFQLPDTWHAWRRNGAKGVQSHAPAADNHVTAEVVRGSATVTCEVEGGTAEDVVKSNRAGLDGREGRYVYVTRVTVTDGRLEPGDEVDVVFGDTTGGSRGFVSALQPEGPEVVGVEVHLASGDAVVLPEADSPVLDVRPGPAFEVLATLPSTTVVGEPTRLRLVVVDAETNAIEHELAVPQVVVRDGGAQLGSVAPTGRRGAFEVEVTPTEAGVLRLEASVPGTDLRRLSNPSWVSAEAPHNRLYWGDLHSHSDHSFDAVGHFPYEYARDVSCLDFYALTEHCERWAPGMWQELCARVDRFHEPGRFVTLLAYEATFSEPWGHHNVYFREATEAVVSGAHTGTLLDLWRALRGRTALTIPHHTGVAFSPKTAGNIPGSTSPAVSWQYHDPQFRHTIEIYSGHGQCELFDPQFDLSYENSDFSTNTSRNGPHYAWDAWERGLELATIASSDNHRGQPGRGELGLAAVRASSLEREHVFDALRDRHTYGTTGARMLLDFTIGGAAMGSTVRNDEPAVCRVRVAGTDELASVEIISGEVGVEGSTEVVASWQPEGMDFDTEWTDPRPVSAQTRFYYVRARQHEIYRGRRPTAWSSPIWSSADGHGPDHPGGQQRAAFE